MIIPGLFLKMPQRPWTLISRSCWVFAGVPVGNVTFKLTPSLELRGNHEDRTDRPAEDLTVRHWITPALALNRETSSVQPWVHEQHVLHNLVKEYTTNIVLQWNDEDIQRQQTNRSDISARVVNRRYPMELLSLSSFFSPPVSSFRLFCGN